MYPPWNTVDLSVHLDPSQDKSQMHEVPVRVRPRSYVFDVRKLFVENYPRYIKRYLACNQCPADERIEEPLGVESDNNSRVKGFVSETIP